MNKRKLIYFLSAFVLIIGCYALNLSYSLFTQNISSENNVVDTNIPVLNASLEEDTFTLAANSKEVINLKIINSGTANIQYGISIQELPEGANAYLVDVRENDIVGNIENQSDKEVLIYIENNANENTIKFNLTANYETVSFDKEAFINNSKIDRVNKVKLLKESILARAKDNTITDANKTVYDEEFDSYNITGISGENERKLILAYDDYDMSYIFRGAVKDNYVNFAGFTWRIVRINGDGSIRLILDGTLDKICVEKNTDGTCEKYAGQLEGYNSPGDDANNAYIGYMYGLALNDYYEETAYNCLKLDSELEVKDYIESFYTKESCEANGGKWTTNSYQATHANVKDSVIKTAVDKFYETYIENNSNNSHYEKYLSDTIFCNDKTFLNADIGFDNSMIGVANLRTYYSAAERLLYSSGTTLISEANPTLSCAQDNLYDYSRFTAGNSAGEGRFDMATTNQNDIPINNDLKYPIGLLSADELVLAGAWRNTNNESYYLNDAYKEGTSYAEWYTSSPSSISGGVLNIFIANSVDNSLEGNNFYSANYIRGVRPVINLKANTILSTGNGTKGEPYVLK